MQRTRSSKASCPKCGSDMLHAAANYCPEPGFPNISPKATPNKPRKTAPAGSNAKYNRWEAGVPTKGGLPYLDEQGQKIGQKEWSEKYRRKFEEANLA